MVGETIAGGGISLGASIAHDYLSGKYDDKKIENITTEVADEVANEYDLHTGDLNPLYTVVISDSLGEKAKEYKRGKGDVSINELATELEETWTKNTDEEHFDYDSKEIIEKYFSRLTRRLVANTDAYQVILFDYISSIEERGRNTTIADDFKEIQQTAIKIDDLLDDVAEQVEHLKEISDIDPNKADKLDKVNEIIRNSYNDPISENELKNKIRGVGLTDEETKVLLSLVESALRLDKKTVFADIDELGTELGPPLSGMDKGWGQTPREAILSEIQRHIAFSPHGTEILTDDSDELLNISRVNLPQVDWENKYTTGRLSDIDDGMKISYETKNIKETELVQIKIENIWVRVRGESGVAKVKYQTAITAPRDQYESSNSLFNWVGLGWEAERISTEWE